MNLGGVSLHGTTKHDTTVNHITSGTYTGNDTANRAIPHSLGQTPKLVVIEQAATRLYHIDSHAGKIELLGGTSSPTNNTVTAMDSTNFYVGTAGVYPQSANENTIVYNWVAFY